MATDRDDEWLRVPAPELAPAEVWVRVLKHADGQHYIGDLMVRGNGAPITARDLRNLKLGRIEANLHLVVHPSNASTERSRGGKAARVQGSRRGSKAEPVTVYLGTRERPDEFYAAIAARYRELIAETPAPAPVMADQYDRPVTTIHRWIREARKRGLLAAGKPGKAG